MTPIGFSGSALASPPPPAASFGTSILYASSFSSFGW